MSGQDPVARDPEPEPALTPASLQVAVQQLAARDPDLAAIVERYGPPPLWDRAPGFASSFISSSNSKSRWRQPKRRSTGCGPRPTL
ncbi:MAG: hypothetical protein ABI628_03785 [Chloroflexota bacterium]